MLSFKKYLNPTFGYYDSVCDFTDIQSSDQLYSQENPYLISTIEILKKIIDPEIIRLTTLEDEIEKQIYVIETSTGDDKADAVGVYNALMKKAVTLTNQINRSLATLDSPYFGKIIFNRQRNVKFPAANLTVYIGKFALFDRNTNKVVITDWRAPIANIYYQNSGPVDSVSFASPVGEQTGNLTQKRQFEVARGRIDHIYDAKTGNVAADEFLLAQLKKRIGKKLTDIVSTIQSQQNSIIREVVNKPVIIQGVAGSGKTTILLHRLAYLFFAHNRDIKPQSSLIIAPNKMFLDYISDVLPSLGIEGMNHNTYLYWAKTVLGWGDNFIISSTKDNLAVKEFKGSYVFKQIVDKFIDDFELDLIKKIDDPIREIIEERYFELKEKHPAVPMIENIDLAIDYAFAQKQFSAKMTGNFMGNLEEQLNRAKLIKAYVRKRINIFKLYKELFKFDYIFKEFNVDAKTEIEVKQHTFSYLKSNKNIYEYKVEDLAPLVQIFFKMYNSKDFVRDYIVVDEAQDLSVFQILTLLKIAKNGNLTIAGDLAQSIVPPFSIKDWGILKGIIEKELGNEGQKTEVSYHQLNRCYRTTVEIIKYANSIFEKRFPKTYKLPEAVLRHGEDVEEIAFEKEIGQASKSDIENLSKIIEKEFKKGFASIAIACKDEQHSQTVLNKLLEVKPDFASEIYSHDRDDYHTGLLVLPISKAKGLEFDCVILADFNGENYQNNELDTRLLYVAVTRALHKLYLLTNKTKPKFQL